jgi:hypothetical protein
MRRESIFDMDIDILPQKYSDASYLRGALAVDGIMDMRGLGTLTTVEMMMPVEFRCMWEPYVCSNGLILVYFEFPSRDSYIVVAIEDFLDRIKVV